MYVTTIEKVSQEHHRSPIIIHDGWQWYFAEFNNWEQLQSFLDFAGLEIKLEEEKADSKYGIWRKYSVNKMLDDPHDGGFWKIADLLTVILLIVIFLMMGKPFMYTVLIQMQKKSISRCH